MPKYKISVVGMGFVGVSLAMANAKAGFKTVGVDSVPEKIEALGFGRPGFFEPGLDGMLADSISKGIIRFTTDTDDAVRNTDITFLAVGTPNGGGSGGADLSFIREAVERIAASIRGKDVFHLLVVKSTVPPLTTQTVIMPALADMIDDRRADVVVNPEFLREGSMVADILKPHLIVVGSNGGHGYRVLEEYYRDFYGTLPEIMHTNLPTAEIIKYANNAFLATKLSFINSISNLCRRVRGADVETVACAIGKDPRIGPEFLKAGPGFGGSCLPKDLAGLIDISRKIGVEPGFFKAVQKTNDLQLMEVMEMMDDMKVLAEGRIVAVLGLAFKGGTDDVRGSVSVRVVEELLRHGLDVRVHDPMAMENFGRIFGDGISYCPSVAKCLDGADCCVILTNCEEYRKLMPHDFAERMGTCNVIDARRTLDPNKFKGTGFAAMGLGGTL